jgi:hypothetical protein
MGEFRRPMAELSPTAEPLVLFQDATAFLSGAEPGNWRAGVAAMRHAAAGGRALHLFTWPLGEFPRGAARASAAKSAVDGVVRLAHLFDRDPVRLERTALQLGMTRGWIQRAGTDRQHVDVWGAPLRKAIAMAERRPLPPREGSDGR